MSGDGLILKAMNLRDLHVCGELNSYSTGDFCTFHGLGSRVSGYGRLPVLVNAVMKLPVPHNAGIS
jgi:hypothetical protein